MPAGQPVRIVLILVGYLGHSAPTFPPELSRRAVPTLATLRAGEPVLKWSCRLHGSPAHAAVSGVMMRPGNSSTDNCAIVGSVDGGAAAMFFLHKRRKGAFTARTGVFASPGRRPDISGSSYSLTVLPPARLAL